MHQFFALGGIYFTDAGYQFHGIGFAKRALFRVDFGLRFDAMLRKKLLRFTACLSARSVVTPVKFSHDKSFWFENEVICSAVQRRGEFSEV